MLLIDFLLCFHHFLLVLSFFCHCSNFLQCWPNY